MRYDHSKISFHSATDSSQIGFLSCPLSRTVIVSYSTKVKIDRPSRLSRISRVMALLSTKLLLEGTNVESSKTQTRYLSLIKLDLYFTIRKTETGMHSGNNIEYFNSLAKGTLRLSIYVSTEVLERSMRSRDLKSGQVMTDRELKGYSRKLVFWSPSAIRICYV